MAAIPFDINKCRDALKDDAEILKLLNPEDAPK
jgi:hypothetical protein